MTKKTISELPAIGNTQLNVAVAAIEQSGTTSKASIRPNPSREFNITTQQQLLDQFPDGSGGIKIPDGTSVTLYFDEDVTLTTPIKIGTGTNLEITAQVAEITIIYAGGGAVIQNDDITNEIGSLRVNNLDFTSAAESLNDFLDVKTTFLNSVVINSVNLTQFKSLGTISTRIFLMTNCIALGFQQGFIFDNLLAISIQDSGAQQISATPSFFNPTLFTVLADTVPTGLTFERTLLSDPAGGNDSLVFFDPNATDFTNFGLIRSSSIDGPYYQQAEDVEIISAEDISGTTTRFTLATPVVAVGTVTCVSVQVGNTFTVNGLLYTAVASAPNSEEFIANIDDTITADNLASAIAADTRTGIDVPSFDQTAGNITNVVTIVATTDGILGNSIGLSSSDGVTLEVSAPRLVGGAGYADINLAVNDVVFLRGFSEITYNGRFDVTGFTNTTFDIPQPFVSNVPGNMDISIKSSSTGTTSPTTFTTNVTHGLQVGKAVVLSNFLTETDYNRTFIVTAITNFTFDVDFVDLNFSEPGTLNAGSLNSSSPFVTAENNVGLQDSMAQSESSSNVTLTLTPFTSLNQFQNIQNGSGAVGDFTEDPATERFTVATDTGIISYNAVEPATFLFTYSYNIEKETGGASNKNYAVALFVNGVEISKTNQSFETLLAPVPGSFTGLITIPAGATITLEAAQTELGGGFQGVIVNDLNMLITEA